MFAGFELQREVAPVVHARKFYVVNDGSPDNSLDMGTSFDCFDSASHTASRAVGAEQRRWRNVLVEAMRKHGFGNYDREWWHFSYAGSGRASPYDFPIRAR